MGIKTALAQKQMTFKKRLEEAALARAERDRLWDVYRGKATEWLATNATPDEAERMATNETFRDEMVQSVAETLSIADYKVPPNWSGWVVCANCGTVPAWAGSRGQQVVACPWCHTVGDVIKQTSLEL